MSNRNAHVDFAVFPLPDSDSTICSITANWGIQLSADFIDLELHESTKAVFDFAMVPLFQQVPLFHAVAMHIFTDGSYFNADTDKDHEPRSAWAMVVVFEDCNGN